jgi:hypothetical protein
MALERGSVCWKHWAIPLCYQGLLVRLKAMHPDVIAVRSYEVAQHSIISDFVTLLDLSAAELDVDTNFRTNRRLSLLDSFALFCKNRSGKAQPTISLRSPILELLGGQDCADMSELSRRRILERFSHSNQCVRDAFGPWLLPWIDATDEINRNAAAPCFDDIFSSQFALEAVQRR